MATSVAPKIASGALLGIADSLQKLGLDPSEFIDVGPVEPGEAADTYEEVEFLQLLSIYKRVAEHTRQPDIGLKLGNSVDLAKIGPFGHLLSNAPTVGAALKDFVRFFPVLQSQAYVGLKTVDNQICVEYSSNHPEIPGWELDSDATVGFIIRIVNSITDRQLLPSDIHFDHPPISDSSDCASYASRTPSFGRHMARVFYPREIADLATRGADPFLYSILSRHMRDLANALPVEKNLVQQIENSIRRRLGTGSVTIQDIATELGHGTRTLQRRLLKHDTTFQKIFDKVRLDLANYYLTETTLDITQVGVNVGFADASAFSHTFKKWTGMTPGERRSSKPIKGASARP